ncbi:hypothetical protein NSA56_01685 [Oceanobacillus caeni]|uniref:hypothetical protein n=1 Tax=Oceanobacillus caeni TaxID=405946 RepID=UPI002149F6B0|nr:hypothetical protein [Oceanobacillus caeni]MCR1833107.1 hypothetical protein [Oceanobacillus caeni]
MNKSMFLKSDQERASQEADCYIYCISQAMDHFMQGDYVKASCYHENAIRSLDALGQMKKDKQEIEKAKLILNQISPEAILRRMLS